MRKRERGRNPIRNVFVRTFNNLIWFFCFLLLVQSGIRKRKKAQNGKKHCNNHTNFTMTALSLTVTMLCTFHLDSLLLRSVFVVLHFLARYIRLLRLIFGWFFFCAALRATIDFTFCLLLFFFFLKRRILILFTCCLHERIKITSDTKCEWMHSNRTDDNNNNNN